MAEVERITDTYRIVFPRLGIDFIINPVAFSLFGIEIRWYSIIITLGVALAMLYCFPQMKRFGINSEYAIDSIVGGMIGGIIGARAYYVLLRWEDYRGDWKSIINTRNGGMAIYGGIIGAVLADGIICKIRKIKLRPMLDITGLGLLIGQGVGLWGNFVNQEAFGSNTDTIMGMTGGAIQNTIIDEMSNLDGKMYQNGLILSERFAVHPCFLYESIWCIIGFVFLARYANRRKFDGQIFMLYLAWYGVGRFFIEGLRTDSLMIGSMRASQVLAAALVIISITMHTALLFKHKNRIRGENDE